MRVALPYDGRCMVGRARTLPLLLGLLGCSPKSDPQSGADDSSSVAATENETSAGEVLGCEQDFFGCPLERSFRAGAFDSCLETQESVSLANEAFDALAGDTPVAFEIQMSSGSPDSACASLDDILVIGDGTAIVRRTTGAQFGTPAYYRRVEIKPASFFEECKTTTDLTAQTVCLREWFVPDTCIAPLCCPVGDNHPCE
jgi:hypothetical protein